MTTIRPKQDRRIQLLAAARSILAEKGFEGTTVSEIVARAGVAQGTFYLYFPSKFAIVRALNEEMNERVLVAVNEVMQRSHAARELVEGGVAAAFDQLGSYSDVLNVIHARTTSDQAIVTWEQMFGSYHALIAELIRTYQGTGEIDSTIHADIMAKLIVGMIHHAADECFIYNPGIEATVYIAEMVKMVSRALGLDRDLSTQEN